MEQKGCCRKRHEANEKFRGFVCECECHSSQNSGEKKEFWESEFDAMFVLKGTWWFGATSDFKAISESEQIQYVKKFIREEIDRAERRVREQMREKIEESWTDFDGKCEGESCRLYRKILNLL